jgi:hypothetical protein
MIKTTRKKFLRLEVQFRNKEMKNSQDMMNLQEPMIIAVLKFH